MTQSTFRLSHLRAIGLALLALGLIIKPSMTQLNELHRAQHTLSADKFHRHSDHDHVADHADGGGSHVGSHHHDDLSGTRHTDGPHGLLHQAGDGAFAGIAIGISLTPILDPSMALQTAAALPPIQRHLGPPLRPPIA